MTQLSRLAVVGLVRRPGTTLARIAVLTVSVGLLGSMLIFVGNSLQSMGASAVGAVPLDWQGPVSGYSQAKKAAARVQGQSGILQASATATAPFAGVVHRGSAGSTGAGQGAVLAVPPGYTRNVSTIRLLHGSIKPDQVVLDQQLAATLKAQVGDTVGVIAVKGAKPTNFRVSGVGLVTASDVLFQPLNPAAGPAPAQPPPDIAVMPTATFARTLAPQLGSITPASVGSNAVPGAQTGVQWQVQVQVDPAALSGSPSQAYTKANALRNRVESVLTGKVQFVDNLSDGLQTSAGDALYAQALYIMLALPGALVGLGLAYLAALGTVERDRRDLALLRARGANRRYLLGMGFAESVVLGVVAGLLGAGLAISVVPLAISGSAGSTTGMVLATILVCVLVAIAGAAAARIAASHSVLRGTVSDARGGELRPTKPLWQRLWLDIVALALSGLIYWLTARTGFSAVVNPDSNPTLSLSIYMFFAPALLWIGATLLVVRLRGRALAWMVRRGAGERPTTTRGFLLASAGRRGGAINRGLLVVGLLLAFGVNLGVFSATWNQQANVDAQLTIGADVVATAPPGTVATSNLDARIAQVPGISATTAVDHSYAYVGPDLQDTFGIDPTTITGATTLRDSYVVGGTVTQMLDRLRATPDGIIVAQETITDYSLHVGDLLRLRVLNHQTGRFGVVPFHVVGTVAEFPSAPRDSFMVANLGYLARADHSGPNVVFAKASGDPASVAGAVTAAVRPLGATVQNISDQTAQTVSSITTVSMSGISRILEVFAIVLAAAAMAILMTVAAVDRRHEFATMAALGAPWRKIGAFLWSEAAIVLGASLLLAAGLGLLLSEMLVAMLKHAFDPPPDQLAIPAAYLLELVGAAGLATLIGCAVGAQAIRHLRVGRLLREQ